MNVLPSPIARSVFVATTVSIGSPLRCSDLRDARSGGQKQACRESQKPPQAKPWLRNQTPCQDRHSPIPAALEADFLAREDECAALRGNRKGHDSLDKNT